MNAIIIADRTGWKALAVEMDVAEIEAMIQGTDQERVQQWFFRQTGEMHKNSRFNALRGMARKGADVAFLLENQRWYRIPLTLAGCWEWIFDAQLNTPPRTPQ